jgi:predicted ABC-type ATPase
MSHLGKVAFLQQAMQTGYRTYLYSVATDDPTINVSRVANRVAMNGHDVPFEKTIARAAH